MLYEAKQGSKAYEYIKSILDAEFEEHQAHPLFTYHTSFFHYLFSNFADE